MKRIIKKEGGSSFIFPLQQGFKQFLRIKKLYRNYSLATSAEDISDSISASVTKIKIEFAIEKDVGNKL